MNVHEESVTDLLRAWSEGDPEAEDALMDRIYRQLRRMAAVRMREERTSHTLQPTALVHEVFLRLVEQGGARWRDRRQFFYVAGRMMRRVLVDHARGKGRAKRAGSAVHVSLEALGGSGPADGRDPDLIIALDEALEQLAGFDRRRARVVELHFLVGLSVAETAVALGCSEATVSRDWRLARAWLLRRLEAPRPTEAVHGS